MKATLLSPLNNEATIISLNKYIEPELKLINTNPSVLVYNNGIYKRISVNEIIMIKAESNYSYIILENDEKLFTSRTIKHWTNTFNSASLLRIHKTYLVNVNKIKEINANRYFRLRVFSLIASMMVRTAIHPHRHPNVPTPSRKENFLITPPWNNMPYSCSSNEFNSIGSNPNHCW